MGLPFASAHCTINERREGSCQEIVNSIGFPISSNIVYPFLAWHDVGKVRLDSVEIKGTTMLFKSHVSQKSSEARAGRASELIGL
jgi:hypothetical protein